MQLPAKSPVTLTYGATTDPYSPASPHTGVDFAPVPDDTIYAPCSGRVSLIPNNGKDGNGIYLTTQDGQFHGLLHSREYLVQNGQFVQQGQPVGKMGDTGYAFGVHLHWCVKVNNQFINPMSLVSNPIKEDDMPNEGDVHNAYLAINGRQATADEVKLYTSKPWSDPSGLYYDKIQVDINNMVADIKAKQATIDQFQNPTQLKPGVYEIK